MLVVRLELHNANTCEVSTIGSIKIANMGMSETNTADYNIGEFSGAVSPLAYGAEVCNSGYVLNHDRGMDVWTLVSKALKNLGYGKSKEEKPWR